MRQQGRWRNPAPALVPAANLSLAASLIILLHRVLSSLYSSTQVDEFFPTFFPHCGVSRRTKETFSLLSGRDIKRSR